MDEKAVDDVASAMHAFFRYHTPEELQNADIKKEFAELDDHHQASNRAAAKRMGQVLAVADLELIRAAESEESPPAALQRLNASLEQMAEEEHRLWCEFHLMNGWSYADIPAKDPETKQHPLLIEYSKLPEEQKDKDREQVRNYPTFARIAGYQIGLKAKER